MCKLDLDGLWQDSTGLLQKNSYVHYGSVEDKRVSRPLLSAYLKDYVNTVDIVINYV